MICTQCGSEMVQTDKNTMTGRVIREYECRNCGHSDWEDDGVALWQVLHDAYEKEEDKSSASPAPTHPDVHPPEPLASRSLWHRFCRIFRNS